MRAILQTCIDVEERVGEIYRLLAEHPQAGKELREIWLEMADDEDRHAQRIELVGERLENAGVRECGLSAREILALLDRAGEILQETQEDKLSLEDAPYVTVELEDAFLQAHLGMAAAGSQPDLQTMFKTLAEADRRHTERIRSYLDRLHDGSGLVFS